MKHMLITTMCVCLTACGAEQLSFPELPDSPSKLIETLKHAGEAYTVHSSRLNYVKESDLSYLVRLLGSNEACAFVVLSGSSIPSGGQSTVGHEAAYLIEGFWKRYYPTRLTSKQYREDVVGIKNWYEAWTNLNRLAGTAEKPGSPSAADIYAALANLNRGAGTAEKPGDRLDEAGFGVELPDQPSTLIETLRNSRHGYSVRTSRLNYVKESDLPNLIALLDSKEPCGPVVSPISSFGPSESTVGHEAAYLIEGFWSRYYPTRLTSRQYIADIEGIKRWYQAWSNLKRLAEEAGPANGSQPIRLEANRTSSATVSGR